MLEKFLSFWLPEMAKECSVPSQMVAAQMPLPGKQNEWPSSEDINQAIQTFQNIYTLLYEQHGYTFLLKQKADRRLWMVIGSHLKALQGQAQ